MKPIIIVKLINAPVDKVFGTIAHIEEFSKVVDDIIKVEFISENKTGIGTRFRETRLMKGKEASTELEIREYIENEMVRIVSDSHGTIWDTIFTVEKVNGATKLTTHMRAIPGNFFTGLINSLIKGLIEKAIEKDMEAVKNYCEN